MENVTLRKKTKSINDLTILSNIDDSYDESISNENIHDSSVKSLPNYFTDTEETNRLKSQITQLKTDLESAHVEIENLLIENSRIKSSLEECLEKINLYKQLGVSETLITPSRQDKLVRSSQRKKNFKHMRCLHSENIDISIQHHQPELTTPIRQSPTLSSTPVASKSSQSKIRCKTDTPSDGKTEESRNKTHNIKSILEQSVERISSRTLHIFGDQQISGLYEYMIQNRKQNTIYNYNISSFVKPYSLSNETLKCCNSLCNLSQNDMVILAIGANDRNPYDIVNALSIALEKLQQTQVYIIQVIKNPFLNEHMINNHIRALVNTYQNCKLLSLNRKMFFNKAQYLFTNNYNRYLYEVSLILNYEINSENYNSKFLNIKNLKRLIKERQLNSTSQLVNKTAKVKKGTIPYYFQAHSHTPNQSTATSIHKKGTIPFYFSKRNNNQSHQQPTSQSVTNTLSYTNEKTPKTQSQNFFRKPTT